MKKKRIKTNILVTLFIILLINVGLIARIDNSLLTFCYISSLLIIGNTLRKRIGVSWYE